MRTTSHDVAKLAGVSQPTVSRALRDQPGVSAATRSRVREAAAQLRYVTSQTGRALSTSRSRRIGIVSAELTNPFYPTLLEPLNAALSEHGYRCILVSDAAAEPVELETLIDGSLDGVVLTTCRTDSTLPAELAHRGIPYVLVNRTVDGIKGSACVADNRAGARTVARFLADLGHERIGAIFGPPTTSTGRDRARSFAAGLRKRGLSLSRHLVRSGPFAEATGRTGLLELLTADPPPTAIFCGNDVIALGALNGARRAGIRVPEQLTIVGFDDIPMAGWDCFDLTTIRTDLVELARTGADLLVTRIHDGDAGPSTIVLPTQLVRRGTHAPPPA